MQWLKWVNTLIIKQNPKSNTEGYFQKLFVGFATEVMFQNVFRAIEYDFICIRIVYFIPKLHTVRNGMIWVYIFGNFYYIMNYNISEDKPLN